MTNPTQSETLLPCPFCGHEAVVVSDNGRGLMFNVHCGKCRASGPWERCASDAKHEWNTRFQSISNETLLREAIQQALAHRYGDWTGILEAALQSIPEPLLTAQEEADLVDQINGSYYLQPNPEPLLDEGLVALRSRVEDIRDERNFPTHLLAATDELLEIIDTLSIPRLEAGRVTVDEALRLADEAADHAGAGSLTLDNASAQRLMDYGLLHHTDEGWVVSKDIWNASAPDAGRRPMKIIPAEPIKLEDEHGIYSAPDGLPLVDRMREALEPFAKVARSYDGPAERLGVGSPYRADRVVRVSLGDCRKAQATLAKADAALTELEEKSK